VVAQDYLIQLLGQRLHMRVAAVEVAQFRVLELEAAALAVAVRVVQQILLERLAQPIWAAVVVVVAHQTLLAEVAALVLLLLVTQPLINEHLVEPLLRIRLMV
jgi:hypothetical protein